jgi:hypothetical protein
MLRAGWMRDGYETEPVNFDESFHAPPGGVFQIDLLRCRPIILVGPKAASFVLVKIRVDRR